ncbi:MAG: cryptochrome/photolyase family protein [Microthrixaceae bacterium]
MSLRTVWVLGDQLHRRLGALGAASPATHRVLMVRSAAKVTSRRWHRQRVHLYLAAMERLADELRDEGFEVDLRDAPTFRAGVTAHVERFGPDAVEVTEPNSRAARRLAAELGCTVVRSDQFLCHHEDFAAWAATRPGRLRMEDFYRWQRVRLDVLMDGDTPCGGVWNLDADNRQPPPKDGRTWPDAPVFGLDDLDARVAEGLPDDLVGAAPVGLWPTSRAQALERLEVFIDQGLPRFGPHEDAMLAAEWKLAHSVLSSSMNLGLLHPSEVVEAAEVAYRDGRVPLASAEGFIRQVIGWREYVWGLWWLWESEWDGWNELGATRPLPPAFTHPDPERATHMACVANVLGHVEDHAYAHHIERLMVLGNLCLLAGVRPGELNDWMWERFVDGAEWVMSPNVVGMTLHADGGRMATKPYAAGGAYLKRMSDHCRGCRYDPGRRTGDDACPFTTLYWDFLARHEERFRSNGRMRNQMAGLRRLSDVPEVRARATEVLARLDAGSL